jgi:hypothetical protein
MDGFRTPEEDLRSQNKELEFFFSAKTRPIRAPKPTTSEAYSLQLTRTLPAFIAANIIVACRHHAAIASHR